MSGLQRQIPAWVRPYIGIPYLPRGRSRTAIDCWGLFALVQWEQYKIEVPSFADEVAYTCRADARTVIDFIKNHRRDLGWHPIPIRNAREGDGMLFKVLGGPMHIGTIVARSTALHVEEGVSSVVENYEGTLWRGRVAEEPGIGKVVYRHESRF